MWLVVQCFILQIRLHHVEIISNDETEPSTNMSNLHVDDDDDDDDDYLVSNSYVEESLDEDDSVDDISDTDDEVTDIIQPVRIVHQTEGIICCIKNLQNTIVIK